MRIIAKDKKYIIANWKMYVLSRNEASEIASITEESISKEKYEIVIAPSAAHIQTVVQSTSHSKIAAQYIHHKEQGAYTGQNSVKQIKDMGATFCLIGHSEVRTRFNITKEEIVKKIDLCIQNSIVPIVFIGEKDKGSINSAIEELEFIINKLSIKELTNTIFVYEPVWAISSNIGDNEISIEYIKQGIGSVSSSLPEGSMVAYGGSVNSTNINEILNIEKCKGVVIGSASVKIKEDNLYTRLQ